MVEDSIPATDEFDLHDIQTSGELIMATVSGPQTRLVYHTIFDGVNPRLQSDIIALGNEMVNGHKGNMSVNFDGEQCLVFYQPIPQTGWSIALVCPERNF